MRHPYAALGLRGLALGSGLLLLATLLLTLILGSVVPPAHLAEIERLLSASTPEAAAAVLASWQPDVARSFSFLLGFDFLYDLVHNNAAAFLVIWGARRCRSPRLLRWAELTAWVMWLDTALNVFEQLAFLRILHTQEAFPLLPWASGVFRFRTATLLACAGFGVALHLLAFRRTNA